MGEVYVITSGKGGVGKTTSTVNIGLALTYLGKKVCIIDGDIGLRNMDLLLGLENQVINNIVDVIENKCTVNEALIKYKDSDSLFFIASSQTADYSRITSEDMKQLVNSIRNQFDYILIDCPAGIEQGFKNAIAGADKAIIVTMPLTSAIRDADRIKSILINKGINDIKVLVNRSRDELVSKGYMTSSDSISELMGVDLLGIVPDDENVLISANSGIPVVGYNCLSGRAYKEAAKVLCGIESEKASKEPRKGFFKRLFN